MHLQFNNTPSLANLLQYMCGHCKCEEMYLWLIFSATLRCISCNVFFASAKFHTIWQVDRLIYIYACTILLKK